MKTGWIMEPSFTGAFTFLWLSHLLLRLKLYEIAYSILTRLNQMNNNRENKLVNGSPVSTPELYNIADAISSSIFSLVLFYYVLTNADKLQ